MHSRYSAAEVLYDQVRDRIALSIDKLPPRLTMRLLLPLPFQGASRNKKKQKDIRQALELAREQNDAFFEACSLYELGVASPDEAVERLEESLPIFRSLNDTFYEAAVLQQLAFTYPAHARHEDAHQASEEAIRLSRQNDNKFIEAWAFGSRAWAALLAGRYDDALYFFGQKQMIHDVYRDVGAVTLCQTQNSLFEAFMDGEFERAGERALSALKVADEINYPPIIFWANLICGLLALVNEDYVEAQRLFESIGSEMIYVQGIRRSGLALAQLGHEDSDAAAGTLCDILQLALKIDGVGWMAWTLPASAIIIANRGEQQRAARILGLLFSVKVMKPAWLERLPLVVRLQSRLRHQLGEAYFTHFDDGSELDLHTTIEEILRTLCVTNDPYWEGNLKLDTPLTPAEFEILHLIAQGMRNQPIAELRTVSLGTVRGQIHDIYGKLGVNNRSSAIARGRDLGLIP
jgi:DNA-binding CsgD family transcriptional regulator/tetratricopeptide (TPR) repeat protein